MEERQRTGVLTVRSCHLDHSAPHISTESHLGLLALQITVRLRQADQQPTYQVLQPREVGDQDDGPVVGGQQDGGGEEAVPQIEVAVPGVSLTASCLV